MNDGYVCTMNWWNGIGNLEFSSDGITTASALEMETKYRKMAIRTVAHSEMGHVLYKISQSATSITPA